MDRGLFYWPNLSVETWLSIQEEEKCFDIQGRQGNFRKCLCCYHKCFRKQKNLANENSLMFVLEGLWTGERLRTMRAKVQTDFWAHFAPFH